jgi:NAD(P)-dependent dehydrogenase (short-subunit alcohol dehydrogenase family)
MIVYRPAAAPYRLPIDNTSETDMKTVMITGCSSGYGHAIAGRFHDEGWNVIATMRTPRPRLLPVSNRMRVIALDVTQPASIAAAVADCSAPDVLVNNAGLGLFGAFEAMPMTTVREIFETNTFGVMAMTQAVVPRMRERRSGVIVNVTSSATLAPMPLVATYTASKMAIEGFTASLAHELATFDVRVKLVEPGYCPNTRFTENGQSRMAGAIPETYAAYAQTVFAALGTMSAYTNESDVADGVWRAATDETGKLRFPVGADALALAVA